MVRRSAFAFLAAGLLIAGCSGNNAETDTNADADPAGRPPATEAAPQESSTDSVAFTLRDPDGNIHTADEWIGKKPVVINFWGTWCGPCRKEIPDMVKVYDEYGDRIEILGIALNDTPEKVKSFAAQYGMNWEMLMGDQTVAMDFGIRGIPTTYFFDAQGNLMQVEDYNGKIVSHFVGPRDHATFKRAIQTIIAASGSGS